MSSRFSVLSVASSNEHLPSPRHSTPPTVVPSRKSARSSIQDRPLNKSRNAEVSASAFQFLFSELVQYSHKRVDGIADLEKRLNILGYRVGSRAFELASWRAEATSKNPKREIRFLPALMIIHTQLWRAVFGKPADAIEKSVEKEDEYMIIDNDPQITRNISIPRDMSSLSCSAFAAGIVEAALDGLGFHGRVTAHMTPQTGMPNRTTILIKLDQAVMDREAALGPKK